MVALSAATLVPTVSAVASAPVEQGDPVAVLAAVSLADPASLDALEVVRDEPATVAAALAVISAGSVGDTRWAAVYVLANATGQGDALLPLLADPDPTIRTLAAVGAIGQGRREGFGVLIDGLTIDDLVQGSSPPRPVWELASYVLARHTGQAHGPAFDADPADRADSQQRWREWWAANGETLTFDAANELWTMP